MSNNPTRKALRRIERSRDLVTYYDARYVPAPTMKFWVGALLCVSAFLAFCAIIVMSFA